jgi:putative holliday junction resolvase
MARIMAIDYGTKRVGLAVTDPLQIIASALETIDEATTFDFLTKYFAKEEVETVLIGYPTQDDGSDTHNTPFVRKFMENFKQKFPDKPLIMRDESYTSQQAMQTMIRAGAKKKDRSVKGNLDKLSAAIILQEYLGHI